MTITPLALSSALHRHIQDLSTDTRFEVFPPDDGQEDLALIERRKAESYFQYAFCKRIWWQLSPEERSQIRAAVFEENPFYKDRSQSSAIEMECIEKIRRMILNKK